MKKKSGYHAYAEEWKALLGSQRVDRAGDVVSGKIKLVDPAKEEFRHPFEADVHRIQFSAPFRRLAGKTQVHPFAEVDFIHNRLTHSVEVASVARSLARRVGRYLLNDRGDLSNERQIDFLGWIAEAGGLGHDIGNPPYGHAGESAIRAWAKQYRAQKKNKDLLPADIWLDFERFDGNAQAFRMLSRPDLRATSYFRLTAASLGALIKYPVDVAVADPDNPKFNCFSTERAHFKSIMQSLGLSNGRNGRYKRHPISYLTEAADDICYRISDFEDAVLMGLIAEDEVKDLFLQALDYEDREKFKDESLSHIRSKTIGALISEFTMQFEIHYVDIMDGTFKFHDLKECLPSKWSGVLAKIKEKYRMIFSQRRKVIEEIGCYGQINTVMNLLFETLHELKKGVRNTEALSFHTQRIVTLVWGDKYFNENADKPMDWWAHAILDHVSGMTDSYLDKLANELR